MKVLLNEDKNFYLVDVGLKGQTKIEITNNKKLIFNSIKFNSTSYNNEVKLISLLSK